MSTINVVWSVEHQRYFRQTFNYTTNQWEFLDWNVPAGRAEATSWSASQQDSGSYVATATQGNRSQSYAQPSNAQPSHAQRGASRTSYTHGFTGNVQQHHSANLYPESKLPRGEGPAIHGEYVPGGQSLHYEELDFSFQVHPVTFFTEGKVIAVMWNETAGATRKPVDYNTSRSLSEVKHAGNIVYTNVRRFVVVRKRREFCYACPIFTYSGRGCTKNGVRASEHAIAHSWGTTPHLLQGETGITKPAIAVVMAEGVGPLHFASRIYFGIHHPIQYNVKVKDIGYVPRDQVHTLIGNWTEENGGTNQAADVSVNAD